MTAVRRSGGPYIWVTWLVRLLVGENAGVLSTSVELCKIHLGADLNFAQFRPVELRPAVDRGGVVLVGKLARSGGPGRISSGCPKCEEVATAQED